ncbi:ParA family protein [Bifidobacterium biavatii]|uniref:Chromosome partitioning ATPase n=1 Tax=Bifidobacterium biavatii DSM 23969 TaxID=1437608 RepID=A0A086ZD94_9BIFI|nr:ParA family protein [Bifidobacterium biavatii]KFI44494.1 chromosome partitioning ATPase [Bifidobacterium biavatii DSM 23969]
MIVTVANAKGGVAKTTSCIYLAQAALLRDPDLPIEVLDADPQSSATQWSMDAEDDASPLGFDVHEANRATLERVARRHRSGLTLVDTPPAGQVLDVACNVADFVIVPTRPTPLDLQQTFKWTRTLAKPHAVLVLDADPRTTACRDTLESLDAEQIPRFDTVVRHRQDILKAFMRMPDKLWEYADVWKEMIEVLS